MEFRTFRVAALDLGVCGDDLHLDHFRFLLAAAELAVEGERKFVAVEFYLAILGMERAAKAVVVMMVVVLVA